MTEMGQPIYTAPLEEPFTIDETLLSGFLSAINTFSIQLVAGTISSMNFGQFHMNLLSKEGILFVIGHDRSIPGTIVIRLLEELSELFLSKYLTFLSQNMIFDSELFKDFGADFKIVLNKYKKLEDLPLFSGDLNKFNDVENEIFSLCDGTRTIAEIAKEIGKVYFDVMRIIVKRKGSNLKILKKSRWILS